MPRGDQMPPEMARIKALILGDPKAGKSDWAFRAALAGFNVLYDDGDVAGQTLASLPDEAKHRVFYRNVSDNLVGENYDPRMIQLVADFMSATTYLWNDTKQREYSRVKDAHDSETGAAVDEIWEFKPGRLDSNWVYVCDSWTTLSYSAMLAKAQDLGVDLADVEKVSREIYSGVGNRLTNILSVIQKMPCHVIVIGHPSEYQKKRSPDGERVKDVKEIDMVVEWTKMIPKSSSNPHGLTMGKYFSDVGWIDVDKWGKRKLDFGITSTRTSGGHLPGKAADPRVEHTFGNLVKAIGGRVPDPTQETPLGEGLKIHPPGTYIPATKTPMALGVSKTKASEPLKPVEPTAVKGLGGLANLNRK